MTTHMVLTVERLSLWVHIGASEQEQHLPQELFVDYALCYHALPLAASSDALSDAVCYDALSVYIAESLQARRFALVEHMAAHIGASIRMHFPQELGGVVVRVTKYPYVPGLQGPVRCTWMDGAASPCLVGFGGG